MVGIVVLTGIWHCSQLNSRIFGFQESFYDFDRERRAERVAQRPPHKYS